MKVQRKINNSTIVEVEGDKVKDLFERLAAAEEIFGIDKCGMCGSASVRHRVRKAQEFTFYEVVCQHASCHARFRFGQAKGSLELFPQLKDKEGNWKPNGGWEWYTGNGDQSQAENGSVEF